MPAPGLQGLPCADISHERVAVRLVPRGACCSGATRTVEAQASCGGAFTRSAGDNIACDVSGNFTTPCCKADDNHGGAATVQEILDFRRIDFAGCA